MNKPKRKTNHKGEARLVVELDADLLTRFDSLCAKEDRKKRAYIKRLIEQELQRNQIDSPIKGGI